MSEAPGAGVYCECGRGLVVAVAFARRTSLLVRRIGDMGHHSATDWRCADCIADFAEDVGSHPRNPVHPDFALSAEPHARIADTAEQEEA